jgi:DNA-directed RNA polymerase specialized sigma24 family protein
MTDNTANSTDELEFSRTASFELEPVSPEIAARSRKNQAVILQTINDVTAAAIAETMNVHESSVSRFKSGGGLAFAARLLASAGLKVVPVDAIVFTQSDVHK